MPPLNEQKYLCYLTQKLPQKGDPSHSIEEVRFNSAATKNPPLELPHNGTHPALPDPASLIAMDDGSLFLLTCR